VQRLWNIKYNPILFKLFLACSLVFLISEFEMNAQNLLSHKLSIDLENTSIEEILKHLQSKEGISFSYSKSIIKLNQKVSVHFKNAELEEILDGIFKSSDIMYKVKSGIIILQRKPQNIDKLLITGTIKSNEGIEPLEYVGIQLKLGGRGAITDEKGNFSILIKKDELNDSVIISSLGYYKASFPVSSFLQNAGHVVYLKQKTINLAEVKVRASDFKTFSIGNHKIISFGSIYIDTQGQQTALFIENARQKKGTIGSVSYYLSKKGNTNSPFRVRIYERDSLTLKPGNDLLKEVIIAKPEMDGGWFKVDVSQFNIEVPEQGFYVAIEGILANDYSNKKDDFVDIETNSDEYVPNSISYGQRLGYSNKNGENTWHYSLAHTWFQLKEQNYNVMISAEIQTKKHRRNKSKKSE